jgi:hypothetical protein
MTDPTLKPCPFCGESAGWVTDECGIECGRCVATGPWRDLREDGWNSRPIEDALRARAEAAEAALATARAEGAAALLADILAMLDKSAAHDRAEARRISGDDRDALDTRATVTELICTSLAAHFGGPVEGA